VENGSNPLFPVKEDGSRNIDREWDQAKTWAQMEEMVAKGKVRAIGISNCGIPLIEHLEKTWKIVPAVNQVRIRQELTGITADVETQTDRSRFTHIVRFCT